MKLYITFGQQHAHAVNGNTFDKDSVAVIECDDYGHGRELAVEYFGEEWAFSYVEFGLTELRYFPRGLIEVN